MGAHPSLTFSSLSPTKFGKLAERLEKHFRSGKQKTHAPNGNVSPQYREKFPTFNLADDRPNEKPRPEGLPRTGKVNVVGSTAPPIEMYHSAREWKNSTVWPGRFPG
jgi:hypothetical protein